MGTIVNPASADDALHGVRFDTFGRVLADARRQSARIAEATSDPSEMSAAGSYFLTTDALSGFGVKFDDELVGVFSRVPGRGDMMVAAAVAIGARRLDCFDGYLVTLYRRHGFFEVRREANWTAGGPDVVYMARKG